MQLSPPPPIAANELRPGRHWYAVAAGIAAVLIAIGVALGAYRFHQAVDSVDTGRQFARGDTVTLHLEPGSEKTVWGRVDFPEDAHPPECDITGPGAPRLGNAGFDTFLTRDETWAPLFAIEVSQAADYRLTCTSRSDFGYAIGESGGLVSLAGRLILSVLFALLGTVTGAAIVLVTALRRRSHRRRLLAARS
ncbi:hypothetical protein ABZ891_15925 [Streptomyces sp. NPDC047023]|uniref:hypothetical protein n=1 Tax=Streptomyces sp. NPDC047023 TaxID=3155139 RepID=UPI0033FE8A85